ncbi:DUF4019 domain-containing protein [Burkholderia ubonensis]|uniref:DUF4019 domain-containing protein n=1 Tax=Burkholderia ubonensis TaxID=101571 RepID=A0A106Q066_9BURK|nr:DUF4019 domain-containing protein [Burkholderia ubonensis]KVZ43639.1 hypothetical protein WL16_26185 [Burkholderia ubonensis]KWA77334.1 hypothetical protein WL29_34865 [Burkholderia ubonensis]KWZ58370.1 hypothetical protein WK57_17860 [Burkholderia ubonensis]
MNKTAFKTKIGMLCMSLLIALPALADSSASADALLNSASTLLQRIDAGRDDELWKSTAEFVRSTMSQEKFSSAIKQARQSVGAVAKRSWASVSRLEFAAGGAVPKGLYANIDFATTLADGRIVYELVSLKQGDDGQWYLTGYQPRLPKIEKGVSP